MDRRNYLITWLQSFASMHAWIACNASIHAWINVLLEKNHYFALVYINSPRLWNCNRKWCTPDRLKNRFLQSFITQSDNIYFFFSAAHTTPTLYLRRKFYTASRLQTFKTFTASWKMYWISNILCYYYIIRV